MNALSRLADGRKKFLVVEMSMGQFAQDVKLAVAQQLALKDAVIEEMHFPGGRVPTPEEIVDKAREVLA
jgi:pyruvate/2-oxoacid:ferredoxin oxidoreductase alpha subunit